MSPPETAASARLAHVGDLACPLQPGRAPKCPLSAKSDPGPPAHPVSPGFRRRRPVKPSFPAARGPGEGTQDGCGIRAGELGAPAQNGSSKVAASRARKPKCPGAVIFPELAPSPASAGARRTPPSPPALASSFRRESPRHGDPGVPGPRSVGEEVSTGRRWLLPFSEEEVPRRRKDVWGAGRGLRPLPTDLSTALEILPHFTDKLAQSHADAWI